MQLLSNDICKIVLMYDDINDDFSKKFLGLSEGKIHAQLANDLRKKA